MSHPVLEGERERERERYFREVRLNSSIKKGFEQTTLSHFKQHFSSILYIVWLQIKSCSLLTSKVSKNQRLTLDKVSWRFLAHKGKL